MSRRAAPPVRTIIVGTVSSEHAFTQDASNHRASYGDGLLREGGRAPRMNHVQARHDTRRRFLKHIVLTDSNERELEQTTMWDIEPDARLRAD